MKLGGGASHAWTETEFSSSNKETSTLMTCPYDSLIRHSYESLWSGTSIRHLYMTHSDQTSISMTHSDQAPLSTFYSQNTYCLWLQQTHHKKHSFALFLCLFMPTHQVPLWGNTDQDEVISNSDLLTLWPLFGSWMDCPPTGLTCNNDRDTAAGMTPAGQLNTSGPLQEPGSLLQ